MARPIPFTTLMEMRDVSANITLPELRNFGGLTPDRLEPLPLSRYPRAAVADAPLTCIYFIYAETCRVIKIGRANNVVTRLSDLIGSSPDQLRLLWAYAAPACHERELHDKFHKLRSHGEWFRAEAPLTDYIGQRSPGLFRISRRKKAA